MAASPIYTNERMATRALAAEIRHCADDFTALLEERFGIDDDLLGDLVDVQCEAVEKVDVLLIFQGGKTVGLEAKFDHEITPEQLSREADVVDWLALLVMTRDDAADYADHVDAVLTWREVIESFPGSRLTVDDVEAMPLTKLTVERLLRQQAMGDRLPVSWDVAVQRGGSGMPSIRIVSPELPDGRRLRGQVQVTGRKTPASLEATTFEYHIGVQVNDDDEDLPVADDVDEEPGWIPHLRTLEAVLSSDERSDDLRLNKHAARSGSGRGENKLPLVSRFLDGKSWLAKGYTDGWALGIKSTKTPVGELGDLCEVAAEIFVAWFQAETETDAELRARRNQFIAESSMAYDDVDPDEVAELVAEARRQRPEGQ